jgi:hypothetical protein
MRRPMAGATTALRPILESRLPALSIPHSSSFTLFGNVSKASSLF